jgi:hypothetical protein
MTAAEIVHAFNERIGKAASSGEPSDEPEAQPVVVPVADPPIGPQPNTALDAPVPASTGALAQLHDTARKWFGSTYDLSVFDTVLATAAVNRLDGDPVWTLIIGGPGATKTETVMPLAMPGAIVTSTIASEGALLSGTAKKDAAEDATGGLLRKIGASGVLVIKDVTSILSMHRNARAAVLAALREVYDGRWERNIGQDGGRTLTWIGRIALIGACTTAWIRRTKSSRVWATALCSFVWIHSPAVRPLAFRRWRTPAASRSCARNSARRSRRS